MEKVRCVSRDGSGISTPFHLIMNVTPRSLARKTLSALALVLAVAPTTALAQGSLTPSGVPAPTMKTLDQVEARVPIDTAHTPGDAGNLFIISQPGSYYLTGNINGVSGKNGIAVLANNVTINFNGFALVGVPGSFSGVSVSGAGVTNLAVRNGSVRDWPFDGVSAFNAANSRFKEVETNGNGFWGMRIGLGCTIESCHAFANGSASTVTGGFFLRFGSRVINCVVEANTRYGIVTDDGCSVSGCTAEDTVVGGAGIAQGIVTGNGCSVLACLARSNAGIGISLASDCTVSQCASTNNGDTGISMMDNCIVSFCTSAHNVNNGITARSNCMITSCSAGFCTASGIQVSSGCVISMCTTYQNSQFGIDPTSGPCLISNCSAYQNTLAGVIAPGSCTVRDCSIVGNGTGIQVNGDANRIEGNNVAGNTPNADVRIIGTISTTGKTVVVRNSYNNILVTGGTPDIGPQGPAATVTSPWANLKQP